MRQQQQLEKAELEQASETLYIIMILLVILLQLSDNTMQTVVG